MNEHNMMGLREMLEQLPTPELDKMLQAELRKESPDEDSVRLILRVLEDREKDMPLVFTPREEAAWQRYQERVSAQKRRRPGMRRWIALAASLAVVICLAVIMLPQRAEAERFWEMLQGWYNTVLEYFSGEGRKVDIQHSFETDNPGLKQVYDAAIELGAEYPMVPMWLDDFTNLGGIETYETDMSKGLCATLSSGEDEAIYKITVYDGEPLHRFYKDDTYEDKFELEGITYSIARNNERWTAVWTRDNIECSISIDCQEETLRRILKSIYVMEE